MSLSTFQLNEAARSEIREKIFELLKLVDTRVITDMPLYVGHELLPLISSVVMYRYTALKDDNMSPELTRIIKSKILMEGFGKVEQQMDDADLMINIGRGVLQLYLDEAYTHRKNQALTFERDWNDLEGPASMMVARRSWLILRFIRYVINGGFVTLDSLRDFTIAEFAEGVLQGIN